MFFFFSKNESAEQGLGLKKALPVGLFLLPVLISLLLVWKCAVNVPWGDQLDIIPSLLEKSHSGQLVLTDLTMPHNEHRILFPRVVMLGLAWLTGWDTRIEMWLIQVMLVLILWILAREMRFSGYREYWWLVPLPWLLFNLKQWETMLFGVQIAFILPILASVYALHLLAKLERVRHPWWSFGLALMAAIIASFSMMAGLLVWLAGLVVLGLGWQDQRIRRIYLPVWLVMAVLTWLVYFIGLPQQATSNQIGNILSQPFALLRFVLGLLGNALIARQTLAPLAGAVIVLLLILAAVLLWRTRSWRENRFWVGVVVFGLLSLLVIAVGRFAVGYEAAFAPRYTSFSLLLLAALYVLWANLFRLKPLRFQRFALSGLVVLIILSLPIALYRGWSFGHQHRDKQHKQAWVLLNATSLPDNDLTLLHPVPQSVRRAAQILKQYNYSVFRR